MANFKLESKFQKAHLNSILTCTWGLRKNVVVAAAVEPEAAVVVAAAEPEQNGEQIPNGTSVQNGTKSPNDVNLNGDDRAKEIAKDVVEDGSLTPELNPIKHPDKEEGSFTPPLPAAGGVAEEKEDVLMDVAAPPETEAKQPEENVPEVAAAVTETVSKENDAVPTTETTETDSIQQVSNERTPAKSLDLQSFSDKNAAGASASAAGETNGKSTLGNYIVTGGMDNIINIWDVNDDTNELTLRSTIQRHYLGVMTVDVSKDGKYLVTSSLDANVRVWKTETCDLISEAKLEPNEFWILKFSADENFLITGSACGKIFLYDVLTFKKAKVLDTRGKFTFSVAISPNNKCIASGAVDGIINIFDAVATRLVHTLEGHAMTIRTMIFSPDSLYLLTGSDDGYMKIYDVQHANLVATISGHSSWVTCVDITLDGKMFASSSADGTVKLWSFATKKCVHTFREHSDQVWSLKFAPDGRRLVSTSDDRCINVYSFTYDDEC